MSEAELTKNAPDISRRSLLLRGNVKDRQARLRLMGTQALHWVAILVTMNIVLLSPVRQNVARAGN